jgi:uncharacterized protein (TIGR02246 family)
LVIRVLFLSALLATAPALAFESPEALQEAFMAALRAEDADGIAACYAEDADNFTLGKMKGIGPDSARASWGAFFEQFDVISAELTEDRLVREGDLAAAWGLFVVVATPAEGGEPVTLKGRYTDVARPVEGRWLYIADHASMPLPAPEE